MAKSRSTLAAKTAPASAAPVPATAPVVADAAPPVLDGDPTPGAPVAEVAEDTASAPDLVGVMELVSGLVAHNGFMAKIVAAILTNDEFVIGLNMQVDARINTDVPGMILADEDFVSGLRTLVDSQVTKLDGVLPEAVATHLDAQLSGLISADLNGRLPGAIDTYLAERPIFMGADFGKEPAFTATIPATETSIDKTNKAQRALAAEAARAAEALAEQRASRKVEARDNFVALIETPDKKPTPFDLKTVTAAKMLLDDGTAFSIDFSHVIEVADIADNGGALSVRHEAITIGDDMAEPFVVKGIVLIMLGAEGIRAARCELPSTLMVGGGRRAQLGASSLVFRNPR